jgi:AcrR family transcriptional regulator
MTIDNVHALRADAQRNRARILAAAWQLLSEKSPEEISMEEVAHTADVGKGTLYRHYPTKESLFQALIHEGAERIAISMRERIPPEADAPTKLRALVTLTYDAYEKYRIDIDRIRELYTHISHEKELEHPYPKFPQRVRDILQQGVREGSFRPLDLDYATAAVLTLISPLVFSKKRQVLGYSRVELEERVVDFLLHALQAAQ